MKKILTCISLIIVIAMFITGCENAESDKVGQNTSLCAGTYAFFCIQTSDEVFYASELKELTGIDFTTAYITITEDTNMCEIYNFGGNDDDYVLSLDDEPIANYSDTGVFYSIGTFNGFSIYYVPSDSGPLYSETIAIFDSEADMIYYFVK